mgnify:CR=1 FL=1
MKNITKIVLIAVAVFAIAVIFSKSGDKQADSTIKVGVMMPLSGEVAVIGEGLQKAIVLAQAEYNQKNLAAGTGRKVELVVEDDAFDVKRGIAAYQKLVNTDKVDAVIMLSTPVLEAIYKDVAKDGKPLMTIGIQVSPATPDEVFQTTPSVEGNFEPFAAYIASDYDFKNLAIVYENNPGNIQFFEVFSKNYPKAFKGYKVNNARAEFKSLASKLVSEKHDAIAFFMLPENGALLSKEIALLQKNHPQFIFDAQLHTGWADYKRVMGDVGILEGSLGLWFKKGEGTEFNQAFKKMYNAEAPVFADYSYDTFNVLMNAYDSDSAAWIKNIQATKIQGSSGEFSFDANGVRNQPIQVDVIRGGEIVKLRDDIN